ncbi:uncharacterized protein LOC111016674 [Momordica charantia]|uniref:Uncharacterized protein LOC111016674 n=1 Tax=Momordica charantia TaxID=3673 RepID=A0A6J1D181_MOMCH|nr:uncharacterized protein LOC111016674 [Momordica charantia]
MGCCFSRALHGGRPRVPDENPGPFDTHVGNVSGNGTPEEETVKEVLSETPIARPCSVQVQQTEQNNKTPEMKVKSLPSPMDGLPSKAEEGVVSVSVSVSETSQVTEWCSNMSESVSMATTISEQREGDEASSKQSREIGRILPEKKSRVTRRYTQGTESRKARTRKLNEQQSGVSHVRRSRSPATRTARGMSKFQGNMKSSAMTPMKVTAQAGDQQEAATAEKRDEGTAEKPPDGTIQPPNESIENPLVSLECFIFL